MHCNHDSEHHTIRTGCPTNDICGHYTCNDSHSMKCLACARREDNDQCHGSKHRTILVLGFDIGDSIPNLSISEPLGAKHPRTTSVHLSPTSWIAEAVRSAQSTNGRVYARNLIVTRAVVGLTFVVSKTRTAQPHCMSLKY